MSEMHRFLYRQAAAARKKAYAPYSGFTVGAALLCDDGSVYTGVNIENVSFGATLCAERCAVAAAIADGHFDFQMIAIVSGHGSVSPCGICRQVLAEFSDDLLIITGDDEHHLQVVNLRSLLPDAFHL